MQTDGNFTAKAGDIYRMSDLFQASAPTGQTIAGFRVALGDVAVGDGGGKLQLNGADIDPARTSFSADEFAQLTYVAGTHGPQNLVVIAQTGTRLTNTDGSLGALTHEIDSAAVQITANVTGSRSINAMNALSTTPTGLTPRSPASCSRPASSPDSSERRDPPCRPTATSPRRPATSIEWATCSRQPRRPARRSPGSGWLWATWPPVMAVASCN